jgi:hypothetical protein
LLSRARESGSDYGLILTKYALERLLYRLSVSQWRDAFLLKGALLFDLWFDQPHRPTRDIDLLGFGSSEVDDVAAVFRNVCACAYDDGMLFDATTVCAHFDSSIWHAAIAATFARRGTPLPQELPPGLSDAFTQDRIKIQQWKAFLGKNKLQAPSLDALVNELRPLLWDRNA